MAGHAGPLAVHRDGEPGVLLVRGRRTFCEWWLGAGCVKGASPVLRGGGAQSWTSGGGNRGWGASLTNTPRARRWIPWRARQEQWIHPTTTHTREALPYSP
jgi:hypothetical protein